MQSETPFTVKTAAGAVYRKSDIVELKKDASAAGKKNLKKDQLRSPHGEEPKQKLQKKESRMQLEDRELEEDMPQTQQKSEMIKVTVVYQDSQENMTSKDMEVNGGLNLTVKQAKPNNSGPLSDKVKTFLDAKGGKQKEKTQRLKKPEDKKLLQQ